jgi:hypothetical protein
MKQQIILLLSLTESPSAQTSFFSFWGWLEKAGIE